MPSVARSAQLSDLPVLDWSPLRVGTGRIKQGRKQKKLAANNGKATAECALRKSATTVDGDQESFFAEKRVSWVHGVTKMNIVWCLVLLASIGFAQNPKRTWKYADSAPYIIIMPPEKTRNAQVGIAGTGGVPTGGANQKVDGQRKKTWPLVLIIMNAQVGIAGIVGNLKLNRFMVPH